MIAHLIARRAAARDEQGASAVEYGLMIAGVAAVIVFAVFAFGGMVEGLFTGSCDNINTEVAAHTSIVASCE